MSETVSSTRLNKFLALHLGVSRRQADDLIVKGQVSVNDTVAGLGTHVQPSDVVSVNKKIVNTETELVYLALNKPIGYVCSRRDQGDSPTVYNLLPQQYHPLKLVGRLDRDSSGLILLTNDGDFAQRMTHPSYHKVKQYDVTLDAPLEPLHQQMINDFGVDLEDGKSQLTLERTSDNRKEWKIVMHEGRNRQIRRTFAALGYTVVKLHRTDFGPYTLGDIQPGKFIITSVK
jgi:23S rRNA pseudouridine2605 synthase